MEAEDIIQLPAYASHSGSEGADANELSKSHEEDEVEGHVGNDHNYVGQITDDPIEEGQLVSEAEITRDVTDDPSFLHERIDFVEAAETQVLDCVAIHSETGCINDTEVEEGQLVPETESGENAAVNATDFTENVAELKERHVYMPSQNGCAAEHETSNSYPEKSGGSITGVKRMRPTSEGLQPSVHVKYHGLSRQSKQKLEQLLQEWSEWCARNASHLHDQDEVHESGEEIYFPALDVGTGKTSTVSFWMENEVKKPQDKDFVHVEDDSVPLYDRGFALELTSAEGSTNLGGGMAVLDAPRCFNCGSYSHSLKECPKPRDNAVVNNSRKQLKSRRNQTAGMRNLTRYYQDSPGGKYEGLKPGVLAPETRRLLGLGEFDPPPWLNRMREIGYPPGYLGTFHLHNREDRERRKCSQTDERGGKTRKRKYTEWNTQKNPARFRRLEKSLPRLVAPEKDYPELERASEANPTPARTEPRPASSDLGLIGSRMDERRRSTDKEERERQRAQPRLPEALIISDDLDRAQRWRKEKGKRN